MLDAVYVHIPFCKQKCLYCDFNSYDNQNEKIDAYMNALYKECNQLIQNYHIQNLSTIYVGGGTPSFIDEKYIQTLFNILPTADEITIEMNPCTVTLPKLETYKKAGINRVSIGLQTTNNSILKGIGRAHTFEEFQVAYQMIRKYFHNVNVDLMFGLPNQTLEDLKQSVNYLLLLHPEHISCYSLILHQNIFENLPSDETERRMYYDIKDAFKEAGYHQYEISNFAQEGYESKHNLAYWNQKEYIGIGAGASSYINNERYKNEENIEKYIAKIEKHQNVKIVEEIQNIEDKVREYMILKLRLLSRGEF